MNINNDKYFLDYWKGFIFPFIIGNSNYLPILAFSEKKKNLSHIKLLSLFLN